MKKCLYLLLSILSLTFKSSLKASRVSKNSETHVKRLIQYANDNDLHNVKVMLPYVALNAPYQKENKAKKNELHKIGGNILSSLYIENYDSLFFYFCLHEKFSVAVFSVLLEVGGDPNKVCNNNFSQTSLYALCSTEKLTFELLKTFLLHKADLNVLSSWHSTSLGVLCNREDITSSMLALCMMFGGNMMYKNEMTYEQKLNEKTIRVLLSFRNSYLTPLDVLKNKHPKMVEQIPYIPQHLVRGFIKKHAYGLYIPVVIFQMMIGFLVRYSIPSVEYI